MESYIHLRNPAPCRISNKEDKREVGSLINSVAGQPESILRLCVIVCELKNLMFLEIPLIAFT